MLRPRAITKAHENTHQLFYFLSRNFPRLIIPEVLGGTFGLEGARQAEDRYALPRTISSTLNASDRWFSAFRLDKFVNGLREVVAPLSESISSVSD